MCRKWRALQLVDEHDSPKRSLFVRFLFLLIQEIYDLRNVENVGHVVAEHRMVFLGFGRKVFYTHKAHAHDILGPVWGNSSPSHPSAHLNPPKQILSSFSLPAALFR
jgi:hypothetical protein